MKGIKTKRRENKFMLNFFSWSKSNVKLNTRHIKMHKC